MVQKINVIEIGASYINTVGGAPNFFCGNPRFLKHFSSECACRLTSPKKILVILLINSLINCRLDCYTSLRFYIASHHLLASILEHY